MQQTSKSMDSAMAVNEPTEPVCTFAPRTIDKIFCELLFHFKGCPTKATDNSKMGNLCSYNVVQAVQGHSRSQHEN